MRSTAEVLAFERQSRDFGEAIRSKPAKLLPVLPVTDLFHPIDNLAVELFLNGDVRHGRRRRGAVPVLFAGREPDHITRPDLLDRAAFALGPAAAGRHDESLAKRMLVPGCPGARLEGDAGALNKRRIRRVKKRIDTYRASEPLRRSSRGRLRANSFYFHLRSFLFAGARLHGCRAGVFGDFFSETRFLPF